MPKTFFPCPCTSPFVLPAAQATPAGLPAFAPPAAQAMSAGQPNHWRSHRSCHRTHAASPSPSIDVPPPHHRPPAPQPLPRAPSTPPAQAMPASLRLRRCILRPCHRSPARSSLTTIAKSPEAVLLPNPQAHGRAASIAASPSRHQSAALLLYEGSPEPMLAVPFPMFVPAPYLSPSPGLSPWPAASSPSSPPTSKPPPARVRHRHASSSSTAMPQAKSPMATPPLPYVQSQPWPCFSHHHASHGPIWAIHQVQIRSSHPQDLTILIEPG